MKNGVHSVIELIRRLFISVDVVRKVLVRIVLHKRAQALFQMKHHERRAGKTSSQSVMFVDNRRNRPRRIFEQFNERMIKAALVLIVDQSAGEGDF